MLRFSTFRKIRAFLLLTVSFQALCLMGQGVLQDMVLCIGSDGHMAIETAYANGGCEAPTYNKNLNDAEFVRASLDHCGPCLDVDLAKASFFLQSTDQKQVVQLAPSLSILSFVSSASSSQSLQRLKSSYLPSSMNPSLPSLRTIILLI